MEASAHFDGTFTCHVVEASTRHGVVATILAASATTDGGTVGKGSAKGTAAHTIVMRQNFVYVAITDHINPVRQLTSQINAVLTANSLITSRYHYTLNATI